MAQHLFLSLSFSLSLSILFSLTHSLTLSISISLSLSLARSFSLFHSISHILTLSRTHSFAFKFSLQLYTRQNLPPYFVSNVCCLNGTNSNAEENFALTSERERKRFCCLSLSLSQILSQRLVSSCLYISSWYEFATLKCQS